MGLKKNLPVVQRPNKHLARRADVEVTLVSRDNFLLFAPMLHEIASSDLNPSDIVNPIRRMLKRVQFVQANVRSIDLAAKRVRRIRASSKHVPRLASLASVYGLKFFLFGCSRPRRTNARISATADISPALSTRILKRNRSSFEFFSLTNHFIDSGTFLADTSPEKGTNPKPTLFRSWRWLTDISDEGAEDLTT
jgi:hypothetical protein